MSAVEVRLDRADVGVLTRVIEPSSRRVAQLGTAWQYTTIALIATLVVVAIVQQFAWLAVALAFTQMVLLSMSTRHQRASMRTSAFDATYAVTADGLTRSSTSSRTVVAWPDRCESTNELVGWCRTPHLLIPSADLSARPPDTSCRAVRHRHVTRPELLVSDTRRPQYGRLRVGGVGGRGARVAQGVPGAGP